MKRLAAICLVGVLALSVAPARAIEEPLCPAPRCFMHTITLERYTFRFAVIVPEGYDASSDRYPVLYLFMGGAGGDGVHQNYRGWLMRSDIIGFTGERPSDERAIVVLADHGAGLDSLDGTMRWESFHIRHLIPYVDANYRTIADGRHRAIAGLSVGGWVAMHAAARYPDLFAAAGSFSGFPLTLSDPVALALFQTVLAAMFAACPSWAGANDGWLCGGYDPKPGAPVGPLGPFATHEVWWQANDPSVLAVNLGRTSAYLGAGNGVPCDQEDVDDIAFDGRLDDGSLVYYNIEAAVGRPGASEFSAALTRAGVAHQTDLRSCGIHSWRYWWGDLMRFWPLMLDSFRSPSPGPFDLRRVEATFEAWGWTFAADPARAAEFLDVADASCGGVGLSGSGITAVRTASCFAPGSVVALDGARETSATADAAGRIRFTVDLGPAHQHQQFTPAARALEAAGGYWTSRIVTFEEGS